MEIGSVMVVTKLTSAPEYCPHDEIIRRFVDLCQASHTTACTADTPAAYRT